MEVTPALVRELLGRPKLHPEEKSGSDQVGVATGMYYTPTGGDIMFVEATTMRGKGELSYRSYNTARASLGGTSF